MSFELWFWELHFGFGSPVCILPCGACGVFVYRAYFCGACFACCEPYAVIYVCVMYVSMMYVYASIVSRINAYVCRFLWGLSKQFTAYRRNFSFNTLKTKTAHDLGVNSKKDCTLMYPSAKTSNGFVLL